MPVPSELHVKVKNTSAIPLRAAYLHGPYTLYTSCYPAAFDPNSRYDPAWGGEPQYEPFLKAGGTFTATIPVPEHVRNSDGSVTWVVEISSQVIFSTTAAVNYDVLVARDPNSLAVGNVAEDSWGPPGNLRDMQVARARAHRNEGVSMVPDKGVFSKCVGLVVDDTKSLWGVQDFPSLEEKERFRAEIIAKCKLREHADHHQQSLPTTPTTPTTPKTPNREPRKKRKVHFVVLTHGLHSNLGADMLFLKESIDAAVKGAREKARQRRDSRNSEQDSDNEDEDEEVIVRGFPGNAVRTERGIQYLGKRLAKYVLLMTYPDQPYLPPVKKHGKTRQTLSLPLSGRKQHHCSGGSMSESVLDDLRRRESEMSGRDYDYQITSISFIGHSLGGLVQTYAIAYIQKYSPEFFDRIRPINFVALATPFLGLSNENPVYVRFALDLGLVGRTGQDLGLSWTAPRVRTGWTAMIGGRGSEGQSQEEKKSSQAAASKPLLRILPTGPARQVLMKFRNRTVYSNVVNDGIVPLRTSCLLFLDWRGLERVEKARRENGLVSTITEWGWAELTGANTTSPRSPLSPRFGQGQSQENSSGSPPPASPLSAQFQFLRRSTRAEASSSECAGSSSGDGGGGNSSSHSGASPLASLNQFWSIFRSKESNRGSSASTSTTKDVKVYQQSQTAAAATTAVNQEEQSSPTDSTTEATIRPGRVRGDSLYEEEAVTAPPKTTFFESAGDLLRPPLPPPEFLVDPSTRPRTIFHDRIYRPEDIPPPSSPKSSKRKSVSTPTLTLFQAPLGSEAPGEGNAGSRGMKVEEKIARAYHQDLTWRKVLVRLEPDAHNNIIVRRMFANAYGWPVVKHLVDTHFAHTFAAKSADADEAREERAEGERAKPLDQPATETGEEVVGQTRTPTEGPATPVSPSAPVSMASPRGEEESGEWSDRYFEDGEHSEIDD